ELYPRFAEIYYNRGLACRQKDDIPNAVANYSQAIRLDPKYLGAYANRGFANYKQHQLDRALADFDAILQIDPNNADARKSKDVIERTLSDGK
ncbi:MAG: tetratricopeptide repeat protein, partial [Thermoguttaceae bacterium]